MSSLKSISGMETQSHSLVSALSPQERRPYSQCSGAGRGGGHAHIPGHARPQASPTSPATPTLRLAAPSFHHHEGCPPLCLRLAATYRWPGRLCGPRSSPETDDRSTEKESGMKLWPWGWSVPFPAWPDDRTRAP